MYRYLICFCYVSWTLQNALLLLGLMDDVSGSFVGTWCNVNRVLMRWSLDLYVETNQFDVTSLKLGIEVRNGWNSSLALRHDVLPHVSSVRVYKLPCHKQHVIFLNSFLPFVDESISSHLMKGLATLLNSLSNSVFVCIVWLKLESVGGWRCLWEDLILTQILTMYRESRNGVNWHGLSCGGLFLMPQLCQILQKYTNFGESDTHLLTFLKSSSNIGHGNQNSNPKLATITSATTVPTLHRNVF